MGLNIGAGDLIRNVVFKAPVTTKNDQGTKIVSYPVITLSLWAAVKVVNQFRALEAGVSALIDSKEIIVRWAADRQAITKDYLLVVDNIEHVIQSLEVVEDKWLKVIAKSKTNG